MNVFDADNHHEEWIQNDWESDDYIDSMNATSNTHRNKKTVRVNRFVHLLWILFFKSSVISIVLWILLIFGIIKLSECIMDAYFIYKFPSFAHLWQ